MADRTKCRITVPRKKQCCMILSRERLKTTRICKFHDPVVHLEKKLNIEELDKEAVKYYHTHKKHRCSKKSFLKTRNYIGVNKSIDKNKSVISRDNIIKNLEDEINVLNRRLLEAENKREVLELREKLYQKKIEELYQQ
jgi:hypothetical protein